MKRLPLPGHRPAAFAAVVIALTAAAPAAGVAYAATVPPHAHAKMGTHVPWLHRIAHGVRPGVRLDGAGVGGRTEAELRAMLQAMAQERDRAPVDATIDHATGEVVADKAGIRLDIRATVRETLGARPYAEVHTVWQPVPARFRYQDIARLTDSVGTYTTWISGSLERRRNIILAAQKIDNRVIYPGQVFSFIDTVGTISLKRGFQMAPTIQDGEMRPGLGGGICQVSSTLYNAARRSGMRMVERHHHALPVHYVPVGADATVVMPTDPPIEGVPILDFRFRNALKHPVALQAVVHGWKLTIWMQGPGPDTPSTRAPALRNA